MEERSAGSQGPEICAQEKSIITPTNGEEEEGWGGSGGGDFKTKVEGKKEKKTRARKDDAHGTKQCFFNGVHQ